MGGGWSSGSAGRDSNSQVTAGCEIIEPTTPLPMAVQLDRFPWVEDGPEPVPGTPFDTSAAGPRVHRAWNAGFGHGRQTSPTLTASLGLVRHIGASEGEEGAMHKPQGTLRRRRKSHQPQASTGRHLAPRIASVEAAYLEVLHVLVIPTVRAAWPKFCQAVTKLSKSCN